MLKKGFIIVGIIFAVTLVAACSGPETLSERNWGKSFETATYNQMLNPDADKTEKAAGAMDGQAAITSLQKYRTGFKKEAAKQTINLINLK